MKAEIDKHLGVNKEILNYQFAMERYLEAKDEYEETQYNLRDFFDNFNPVNLEDESYEFVRDFHKNMERFCTNKELNDKVRDIRYLKKVEKYPQLLKPTFYPEINQLDIPIEEKMRLDKSLRKNHGYYVSKTTYKKLGFNSLEELELLSSIGIVEKMYEIRCPECWDRLDTVSPKDLELHKKVWDIEDRMPVTEEEHDEWDKLEDMGYGYLSMYCDNCNKDIYIGNTNEFNEIKDNLSPLYKINKMPDLWSEQI